MRNGPLYSMVLLAVLCSVVLSGCVYSVMTMQEDEDRGSPQWVTIGMYVYSALVIVLSVGAGFAAVRAMGDEASLFGLAAMVTWAVGLGIGYGLYWLLIGIHTWFRWLGDKV